MLGTMPSPRTALSHTIFLVAFPTKKRQKEKAIGEVAQAFLLVFVNGEIILEEGRSTGAMAGQVLRSRR